MLLLALMMVSVLLMAYLLGAFDGFSGEGGSGHAEDEAVVRDPVMVMVWLGRIWTAVDVTIGLEELRSGAHELGHVRHQNTGRTSASRVSLGLTICGR